MYKAGCQVLVVHGAGCGEHADKQIRRCRAPIVRFAAARPFDREWKSQPNGLQLGKRTRGLFGLRAVGEGMER